VERTSDKLLVGHIKDSSKTVRLGLIRTKDTEVSRLLIERYYFLQEMSKKGAVRGLNRPALRIRNTKLGEVGKHQRPERRVGVRIPFNRK
jgi:hypothetical protein